MDFIDIPLRTIRFHGPMIKVFGREFKYRAPTVPKAIDAMKNLLPGFERYMLEAHKRGLTFSIFVGKRNIGQDELELTKGAEDIHLVPVVIGSKRAGLFQTILGVALIGAAIAFSPAGLGSFRQPAGGRLWLIQVPQWLLAASSKCFPHKWAGCACGKARKINRAMPLAGRSIPRRRATPSACCTARVKLAGRLSPQAFIPKTSNNHHPFEQTAAIAAFYGRNMAQNMIRGRKGGGGGGHTPVESPDSIQSIARAKMLFALGEGSLPAGWMAQTFC